MDSCRLFSDFHMHPSPSPLPPLLPPSTPPSVCVCLCRIKILRQQAEYWGEVYQSKLSRETELIKYMGFIRVDYYFHNSCVDRKYRNSIVVQSMRPDFSAGHQNICQNPEKEGSNSSEEMNLSSKVRANRPRGSIFFFHVLYISCQQKVQPRFQMSLPTTNDLNLGWSFHLK